MDLPVSIILPFHSMLCLEISKTDILFMSFRITETRNCRNYRIKHALSRLAYLSENPKKLQFKSFPPYPNRVRFANLIRSFNPTTHNPLVSVTSLIYIRSYERDHRGEIFHIRYHLAALSSEITLERLHC